MSGKQTTMDAYKTAERKLQRARSVWMANTTDTQARDEYDRQAQASREAYWQARSAGWTAEELSWTTIRIKNTPGNKGDARQA